MTVGVALVSHSDLLARGVAELTAQMAPDVTIAAAGGTDDDGIGTSLDKTLAALREADGGAGVVVLYDLGSAELITDSALELLDDEQRARVRVSGAPLVTGALAAATAAQGGADVDAVAVAAAAAGAPPTPAEGTPAEVGRADAEAEVTLPNALGLHARPAAQVVQALADLDADVWVEHAARAARSSARSLLGLVGLAAAGGATVRFAARGPDAAEAVARLRAVAEDGFGERQTTVPTGAPATRRPAEAGSAGAAPAAGAQLIGTGVAGGLVVAPAAHLATGLPEVPATPGAGADRERRRLEAARRAARRELAELARASPDGAIFAAQQLLLDDPELQASVEGRLGAGANAAHATAAAIEEQRERLAALPGEVFAARAADVVDVGRRLLAHLLEEVPATAAAQLQQRIVVADDLVPSEVAHLVDAGVAGVALARGAATAHTAVIARNLGLPLVLGLGDALTRVAPGTVLLLDGRAGTVVVDPPADVRARAEDQLAAEATERAALLARAREPASLADGTRIVVAANASTPAEARAAAEHGAEGVGLLRTEVAFLDRPDLPTEDEQHATIVDVCAPLRGELVVVRTLDVGGDKPAPALELDPVRHGFLGVRGVRHSLAHPELFRTQLRAILRAAAEHRLAVMFPMVTTVAEVRAARQALAEAREALVAEDAAHGWPEAVGIMIEVPAAALSADALAREVDFFSIGSNDLVQYVMAADRTLPDVADLYQPDHPAVLELVERVCTAADRAGRWVGVCGEMAADPDLAVALVARGVRELSMAPAAIPAVKQRLRATRLE